MGLSDIESRRNSHLGLLLGIIGERQIGSRISLGGFVDSSVHSARVPGGRRGCDNDVVGCDPGLARAGARARFDALPPSHWFALWAAPAVGVQVFWGERAKADDPNAREVGVLARLFVEQSAGLDFRSKRTTVGPFGVIGYSVGSGLLGGIGAHLTVEF